MCEQQQEKIRLLQKFIINQFDYYTVPPPPPSKSPEWARLHQYGICAHNTIAIGTISIYPYMGNYQGC